METCISTDSLTGTNNLSRDQQANFMSPGIEEWKRKEKHAILYKSHSFHLICSQKRHQVTCQESAFKMHLLKIEVLSH